MISPFLTTLFYFYFDRMKGTVVWGFTPVIYNCLCSVYLPPWMNLPWYQFENKYILKCIRLFSHDGKVHISNRDSRCASWITIRNTVFWTVCTPNHIEIRDLRCVTRKHLWTVIWDAHLKSRISTWFGVHTVQNTVFWIVIQDAHLESRFKIRTLPSCEDSRRQFVKCAARKVMQMSKSNNLSKHSHIL